FNLNSLTMKSYILILLGLASISCIAQTIPDPTGYEAKENLRELGSTSGTGNVQTFDNRYEGTKGTPYVFETWFPGEIFLKSKKKIVIKELNYNCYDNEVAFLDPATKTVRLINKFTVELFYFLNGSDTLLFAPIQPENDGDFLFAQVLYNKGSVVYKRYQKEFVRANYEGGYSADRKYDEFADKSSLYFSKHNDPRFYRVRKSKKQILAAFPDAEDEISSFIKAEKLDLKREEDVVKLLKYYDSL
ncbi:MAG: hypothetical protein U9R49_10070, partial [Bacteroidota bacterium]|nr:hypothetical protein [Bacteroidota bacterium]